MANRPQDQNVDLAALLESVHGKTDQQRRQDQLDGMLGQLEATHRPASAAIRHFEDRGRTPGEAAAAAAMAALVAAEARAAVHAVQDAKTAGRLEGVASANAAELTAAPTLPDVLSDEVTAAGAMGSANVGSSEPTQLFVLPSAATNSPQQPGAPSAGRADAPGADALAPPPPANAAEPGTKQAALPRVYAGRGADLQLAEPTKTEIVRRPKK